jgi:hypothetical protein
MKVTIENPKTVVVVPEQTKTVNEINIKRMVDFPERKMVVIHTDQFGEPITLWEGDAYDAIGDWTNADVEARLKEIYQA